MSLTESSIEMCYIFIPHIYHHHMLVHALYKMPKTVSNIHLSRSLSYRVLLLTDPPDGTPSCTILPTNNYTDLTLWCSWEGGYPHASLHWSPFLPGANGQGYANATLIQRGPGTANNSVFVCHGSHVALNVSTSCSTRTCE